MASWMRIAVRAEDRVKDLEAVLRDLIRCGDFYHSAIELDAHIENPISGEEFEKRINKLNIPKK